MQTLKKYYYIQDNFSLESYLKFSSKIPIIISERTVTYKMYQDFHLLLDTNLFAINQSLDYALKMYIHYDENLKEDGYTLDINTKKEIVVKASTYRGVRYAIRLLNELVEIKDDQYLLPIILIKDEPSFKYRGIIEGYYGEPWSFEEHMEMANFMDEFRLNAFMYAPKVDPYHRVKWYELYPEEELSKLKAIKDNLNQKGIDFYYCISPGYAKDPKDAFQYASDVEFERLFTKLKQIMAMGVTKFGLLLDDIDYKLSGLNKEKFLRPGIAHAYICNKVNKFLKENIFAPTLVMCPTEYHQIGESEYRNDIKQYLDDDIFVFWTGDNVCAEAITESDAKLSQEAFGKDLFIWDNFPVSDFTYGVREFMAPLKNRTVALSKYASGFIINPSLHYQISKVGMITMAHYAWNSYKYNPDLSFEIALRYFGDDFYDKGLSYIMFNYPNVLSYGNLDYEKELVNKEEHQEIKKYYQEVTKSAKELLTLDNLIIEELSPWLKRVIKEEEIVNKIIDNKIEKEELISFFDDIKFSGSELLDYLIVKKNLLDNDEFNRLIKKRRGSSYYRVFEYKRWPQK